MLLRAHTKARFPEQQHTRARFPNSPCPPPESGLSRGSRGPRAAQRTPPGPLQIIVVCARGACAHSANAAPQGGSQGHGWPPARAQATREPRARQGAAKPGVIADRPCDLACAARAEVVQGRSARSPAAASACISKRGNSCPPARPTWRRDRRKWRYRADSYHAARCLPHVGSPQSSGSSASSDAPHAIVATCHMTSLHHGGRRLSWLWGGRGGGE